MPYNIKQIGDKFAVVATDTGKVAGTHPSKKKAQAQLAALYANVEDVKKCMTCGCDDLGNDHHYISDTEKCSSCIDKGQGPCWEGYEYAGTKDQDGKTVPNCIPVKKADGGYQPNAGMKAAARRALKWRDAGMATGAGTPVGWGRASDIVAGRSMSLDTVKRMYSFFSRHEVDKKGKDWNKPSHGKVMWNAWGGDAGFAWSRAIVNKENKIEKDFDAPCHGHGRRSAAPWRMARAHPAAGRRASFDAPRAGALAGAVSLRRRAAHPASEACNPRLRHALASSPPPDRRNLHARPDEWRKV